MTMLLDLCEQHLRIFCVGVWTHELHNPCTNPRDEEIRTLLGVAAQGIALEGESTNCTGHL